MADFETTAVIVAQYPGTCAVCGHDFKKGTKVAKLQRADNPYLIVKKLACSNCFRGLPSAT